MFCVDNNSFRALGNTTKLNDLFVSFPVKDTCEGVSLLKLQAVILLTAVLPKINVFCMFFF